MLRQRFFCLFCPLTSYNFNNRLRNQSGVNMYLKQPLRVQACNMSRELNSHKVVTMNYNSIQNACFDKVHFSLIFQGLVH